MTTSTCQLCDRPATHCLREAGGAHGQPPAVFVLCCDCFSAVQGGPCAVQAEAVAAAVSGAPPAPAAEPLPDRVEAYGFAWLPLVEVLDTDTHVGYLAVQWQGDHGVRLPGAVSYIEVPK